MIRTLDQTPIRYISTKKPDQASIIFERKSLHTRSNLQYRIISFHITSIFSTGLCPLGHLILFPNNIARNSLILSMTKCEHMVYAPLVYIWSLELMISRKNSGNSTVVSTSENSQQLHLMDHE